MLFVNNLSSPVTVKDLYRHFQEAGLVFDVFVRENRKSSLQGDLHPFH